MGSSIKGPFEIFRENRQPLTTSTR